MLQAPLCRLHLKQIASILISLQARAAIVAAGGFPWQDFRETNSPSNTTCTHYFETQGCIENSTIATNALLVRCNSIRPYLEAADNSDRLQFQFTKWANGSALPLPQPEVDLATFLMVRGDYAWLGYGCKGRLCCI